MTSGSTNSKRSGTLRCPHKHKFQKARPDPFDGYTFLTSVTLGSSSDEAVRLSSFIVMWITRCLRLSSSEIFRSYLLAADDREEGRRYQSRTVSHGVVKQAAAVAISLSICAALSCIHWLPPHQTRRFLFTVCTCSARH